MPTIESNIPMPELYGSKNDGMLNELRKLAAAAEGRTIILPLDGIGTDLSELQPRCPHIFFHLQCLLYVLEQEAKGRVFSFSKGVEK